MGDRCGRDRERIDERGLRAVELRANPRVVTP
jgi:hypothetical protein